MSLKLVSKLAFPRNAYIMPQSSGLVSCLKADGELRKIEICRGILKHPFLNLLRLMSPFPFAS